MTRRVLCLLALQAPLLLQGAAPGMSPEMEAQAREALRQQVADMERPRLSSPPLPMRDIPVTRPAEQRIAPPQKSMPWVVPPPRFDTWPEPPPRTMPLPGTGPLPTEALERAGPDPAQQVEGKTLYSFRAEELDLKSALSMFARANKLNIVPDLDVVGLVTLDVQDLPLDRMMQALLEANDYAWALEGGLIRVRAAETRTYVVDYLRMTREGRGSSMVTLSSGSQGGGGGGGGGGMGGGGMGGGGGLGGGGGGLGGGGGGGMGGGGMSGSMSGSAMNLRLENSIEFWKELEEQIGKILTDVGKGRLAINMTAGVIQITDRPSAIRRVERYLELMTHSVARQVDIEAKIYDVTLNDQFQFGIDWARVITSNGGRLLFSSGGGPLAGPASAAASQMVAPIGEFPLQQEAFAFRYTDNKTDVILRALQEQGQVSVVSQPRLRTLNNQTAIMKVGRDEPFFTQFSQTISSGTGIVSESGDMLSVITIGTVLSITPQIATNEWISMDVSPAITSLVATRTSPSGLSAAPILDIKQTSTIVRVRDGETIIIGGLIQDSDARNLRKVPLIGDIPLFGRLFQGDFKARQKKELVIFLTPTIVR